MDPLSLICLFTGHWVGDFLFQTTAMAQNKGHSIGWLMLHTFAYTVTFSIFCAAVLPWPWAAYFALLNGILHGITDFFTSKLSGKYAGNPRIFFPIVGFDQLVHISTIVATLAIKFY